MKNNAVVLGIFILAGIVIGAFVISSSGQEKPQDLKPVNDRIDSLAQKMASFEQRIADLNEKLERNLASIQENDRNISEFKDQLSAAGKRAGDVAGITAPNEGGGMAPVRLSDGLDSGKRDVLEHLKEEVKREIKEENKIAKQEQNVKGAKKWVDWQTAQLRKKLDDEFSKLAEKIELDRNQEQTVKDIAEEMLRQIATIWSDWEDRLATATNEEWGEFKGELGSVYEDAERQLQEQVNEEQARAIMRFLRESGK